MRRIFLVLTFFGLFWTSPVVAAAPKVYGAGSFTWPNSPGKGHLGLYIDDDISHTRLMSTIRNADGQLCTSTGDAKCGGSTVYVYAVLPACTSSGQTDCIESVGSKNQSGSSESGTFSRYFPEHGLGDFAGDTVAKIPTGASPSIWSLPGTPHPAGDEYMAVVSVSGTSSATRTSFTNVTLHASLYPVKVVAGRFSRNIPSPQGSGVSHPSTDTWSNCASLADGYCAARQDFPAGTAFSLGLRLSTAPTGWLHGRIFAPNISFSTTDGVTRLRVEATPAQVPAVATWAHVDTLPSSVTNMSACNAESPSCSQLNPQSAGAHYAVEDWRTAYGDKASWVRGHWMYMTLPGSVTSSCLQDSSVLHGFVTTNATGYAAGPPSYSYSDNSFSYTVASPHFDQDGAVISGTYNFVVRSATARCIYGIDEGPMSASVSISERGGSDQTSTATVSVVDDGEWLKVSASGFHYSSPVIKTVLTSTVAPAKKTTPTVAKAPAFTTKKALSAATVARFAGLTVVSGARVGLRVASASSKTCRLSGTSLKGLKKGACRVTVTVALKGKRPVSKTVSLTVT